MGPAAQLCDVLLNRPCLSNFWMARLMGRAEQSTLGNVVGFSRSGAWMGWASVSPVGPWF